MSRTVIKGYLTTGLVTTRIIFSMFLGKTKTEHLKGRQPAPGNKTDFSVASVMINLVIIQSADLRFQTLESDQRLTDGGYQIERECEIVHEMCTTMKMLF